MESRRLHSSPKSRYVLRKNGLNNKSTKETEPGIERSIMLAYSAYNTH